MTNEVIKCKIKNCVHNEKVNNKLTCSQFIPPIIKKIVPDSVKCPYFDDDFRKNLTSFRLEACLAGYCKSTDQGAIIYDDIATILTAIDKP